MDWKKLDKNIRRFADKHKLSLHTESMNNIGQQVSLYQITEKSNLFYELKHVKPTESYGSKLRIYSSINPSQLLIQTNSPFIGRSSLKIKGLLHEEIELKLEDLFQTLKSFTWESNHGYISWPEELRNKHFLVFKSNDIQTCSEQLDKIRSIHIALTSYLSQS